MVETNTATATPVTTTTSTATPEVKVEVPKEDLVTRASKVTITPEVKVEKDIHGVNVVEEPKFDIKDIEAIADPVAKEQALRAYKSFQRGFNQKFQELAEQRKQLETKLQQQPTSWTPERLKQELNKTDFVEASKAVLQEQNPPQSGMTDTEWSSLTAGEKQQWQAMQNEIAQLKQNQVNQQTLQSFRQQDEVLKTKYANYNPEAVDIVIGEVLSKKRQATREDVFKALDYEDMAQRAYELGKRDGQLEKTEKTNATAYDGLTTGKPAIDVPVAEKNESTQSFFGRLVANNIAKQKIQR